MSTPVAIAEDRAMTVPAGAIVRTGYVRAHRVRLGSSARMAVGDVERAYRRRIQVDGQPWPPPVGHWETDAEDGASTFVVTDGRHEVVAALMLGFRAVLVAWVEAA